MKTPQQFVDEDGDKCFTCYLCGGEFVSDPEFNGDIEFRQHTVQTDAQSVCDDCYKNKVVPYLEANGWNVPS